MADVNAPAGVRGPTALLAGEKGGHLKVGEMLLAANADINAALGDRGQTALRAAAKRDHLEVAERLLAVNADVDAGAGDSAWGETALQAAASEGYLDPRLLRPPSLAQLVRHAVFS